MSGGVPLLGVGRHNACGAFSLAQPKKLAGKRELQEENCFRFWLMSEFPHSLIYQSAEPVM